MTYTVYLDTSNMLSNDDIASYVYSKNFKKTDYVMLIDMFDLRRFTIFDDDKPVLLDLSSSSIHPKFSNFLSEEKAHRMKPTILIFKYLNNVSKIINRLNYLGQQFIMYNSSHKTLDFDWSSLSDEHGIYYEFIVTHGYINSETDASSISDKLGRVQ